MESQPRPAPRAFASRVEGNPAQETVEADWLLRVFTKAATAGVRSIIPGTCMVFSLVNPCYRGGLRVLVTKGTNGAASKPAQEGFTSQRSLLLRYRVLAIALAETDVQGKDFT